MAGPFRTTRRIEFVDTDMAGIVHFSNFFRFMEAAEVEFLRTRGLTVRLEWEGRKLALPRVAASCDYLKPARFEEVITIEVVVRRVGKKSVTYGFEFFRGEELLARGQVTACCCTVGEDHELQSVEIPEGIRAKLQSDHG